MCSERNAEIGQQKRATRTWKRPLTVGAVAGAALFFDLVIKMWVRAALPSPNGLDPTPFLALRLRFNAGTTFGLLSGRTETGFLVLVVVTGLLVLALAWWALRTPEFWVAMGAALMAAGALGNLIDRMYVGMVTDFIGVHFGSWYAPIFNLADVWLVSGIVLILLRTEVRAKRDHP